MIQDLDRLYLKTFATVSKTVSPFPAVFCADYRNNSTTFEPLSHMFPVLTVSSVQYQGTHTRCCKCEQELWHVCVRVCCSNQASPLHQAMMSLVILSYFIADSGYAYPEYYKWMNNKRNLCHRVSSCALQVDEYYTQPVS